MAATGALDGLRGGLVVFETRHWRLAIDADGGLVVRHRGLHGFASGSQRVASAAELVALAPVAVLHELARRIADGRVWGDVKRAARS